MTLLVHISHIVSVQMFKDLLDPYVRLSFDRHVNEWI